jgi:hypothetical protein
MSGPFVGTDIDRHRVMKTRTLATLAAVVLVGCSEDETTTTPDPTVDSAIVDDTGNTTAETGGDETSAADGTVEETTPGDGSTAETSATDAPGDTPADAATPRVKCGTNTCNPATEACCLNVAGIGSCIAKAGSCMGVSGKFECSSSDTCGSGQKCCATIGIGGSGSQCKATCASGEVQLCDSNDECTGDAAMCSPIGGSTTGYSRCP